MKKILLLSCGLLIAAGVAIFILGSVVNSILKPENIEKRSAALLGSPLLLKQAPDWSLFPPAVKFKDISWKTASENLKLSAPEGEAELEFWPLLKGEVVLSRLTLNEPTLTATLSSVPATSSESSVKESESCKSGLTSFLIRLLVFNKGSISINNGTRYDFNNINLAAKNFTLAEFFQIDCEFDFNLLDPSGASEFSAAAKVDTNMNIVLPKLYFQNANVVLTEKQPQDPVLLNISLTGDLNLDTLSFNLASSQTSFRNFEMDLAGKGDFSNQRFDGELSFAVNSDNNTTVKNLSPSSVINFSQSGIFLPDINLNVIGNKGAGNLALQMPGNKQKFYLSGNLNIPVFNMNNALQDGRQNGVSSEKTADSKSSHISLPKIEVDVAIERLLWKDLVFTDLQLPVKAEANRFFLTDCPFSWAGGKAQASLQSDFSTLEHDLKISAAGLDMGQALAELGLNGFSGGEAKFSAHLMAYGKDWGQFKSTLHGNAQIEGGNCAIKILENIAAEIPAFFNAGKIIPDKVSDIKANCVANKGILYCSPISLLAKEINCAGNANINLDKSTLAGTLTLAVGKLRLPFIFDGPLSKISWHPGPGFMRELGKILP